MHIEGLVARTGVPIPPVAGPARTRFCISEGVQAQRQAAIARAKIEQCLLELTFIADERPPSISDLAEPCSGSLVMRAGLTRVDQWSKFRRSLDYAATINGAVYAHWVKSRLEIIEQQADAGLRVAIESFHWLDDALHDLPPATPIIHDEVELGPLDNLVSKSHELAHILGDVFGGLNGCCLKFKDGHWFNRCRLSLMHISIGNSVGFTSRRLCNVCRVDVDECVHEPGEIYPVVVSRTPDGYCTACGSERCDHEIGQTVSTAAGFLFADIDLREVSLVDRPRDPLARITGREVDLDRLSLILGRTPSPDEDILHHECMCQCEGFAERVRADAS
jgi:hypothetical protein